LVNEPIIQEETEQQEIDGPAKRSNAFSEKDLQDQFNEIILEFEAKGLHHEALILKEPFDFHGHEITLKISNEALESTFERMRSDLLSSLRDHLQNDHIVLKSVIIEPDKKDMLYTDKEKFEHLKKKYPALKDLQDKFGLDPEF
jgi:hypothetical protein